MKLALLGLCALPLAALRPAQHPAPVDDPTPVECPMCGGNWEMHVRTIVFITATQASAAQLALANGLR
jgi:hypothetical protein